MASACGSGRAGSRAPPPLRLIVLGFGVELGERLLGVRALGLVEIHDAIKLVLRDGLFGRELTSIVELVRTELLRPVQLDHATTTSTGIGV
ncbi:MAG TPA: hypothetical protein VIJ66_06020 [Solirubrobacteraceae bacterium]